MEYQAKCKPTYQDFVVLNQVQQRTYHRALNLFLKVLLLICSILLIFSCIMMMVLVRFEVQWLVYLLVGVFFGVLALFLPYFSAFSSKKISSLALEDTVITFGEERIEAENRAISSQYPYTTVIAIYHKKGRYFLRMGPRQMLILPETSFVEGDPAHFAAFIEERCGQPIQYLK